MDYKGLTETINKRMEYLQTGNLFTLTEDKVREILEKAYLKGYGATNIYKQHQPLVKMDQESAINKIIETLETEKKEQKKDNEIARLKRKIRDLESFQINYEDEESDE